MRRKVLSTLYTNHLLPPTSLVIISAIFTDPVGDAASMIRLPLSAATDDVILLLSMVVEYARVHVGGAARPASAEWANGAK
jgi:hypothetical protein